MKKTRINILLMSFIFILSFTLFGCAKNDNSVEQAYRTPEEAIVKCLKENGIQTTSEELQKIELDRINNNKIDYYLMKGINNLAGEKSIYVYLVGVASKNDSSYTCEKVTADFSLESIDNVEDTEHKSYSECIIPIENIYVHVGMIFNPEYQPYFMGNKLSLDEDNIYFCNTKDAKAETEIRKN